MELGNVNKAQSSELVQKSIRNLNVSTNGLDSALFSLVMQNTENAMARQPEPMEEKTPEKNFESGFEPAQKAANEPRPEKSSSEPQTTQQVTTKEPPRKEVQSEKTQSEPKVVVDEKTALQKVQSKSVKTDNAAQNAAKSVVQKPDESALFAKPAIADTVVSAEAVVETADIKSASQVKIAMMENLAAKNQGEQAVKSALNLKPDGKTIEVSQIDLKSIDEKLPLFKSTALFKMMEQARSEEPKSPILSDRGTLTVKGQNATADAGRVSNTSTSAPSNGNLAEPKAAQQTQQTPQQTSQTQQGQVNQNGAAVTIGKTQETAAVQTATAVDKFTPAVSIPENQGINRGVLQGNKPSVIQAEKVGADPYLLDRINQVKEMIAKTGGSILKLAKNGGGKMSLKLDPPSMGKLQVEVEIVENASRIRILTQDPGVKAALLSGSSFLRDALEAQGLKLENFNVDTQENWFAQDRLAQHDKDRGDKNGSDGQKLISPDDQNVLNETMNVNHRPMMGMVDLTV